MKTLANVSNETSTGDRQGVNHTRVPLSNPVSVFPGGIPLIQRKAFCACDGGCPRCSGVIQPKLTVGAPDDEYEQEADRVADQVMRMPEPAIQRSAGCSSCGDLDEDRIQTKSIGDQITPLIQRQEDAGIEEEPEEEEEEPVQPKSLSNKSPPVTTGLGHRIQSLKGGGKPLSASTRAIFDTRFGRDFSDVRVHTGGAAVHMNRELNAQAFTISKNIFFNSGKYSPGTPAGKYLLAHELVHVMQQEKWGKPRIQRQEERTVPVRTVAAARTQAAEALDIAITLVREAINNLDNGEPIPEEVRCAFERFFPGVPLEFLPVILKRIESARRIVETVQTRHVTRPVDLSVTYTPCADLINYSLRRGDVPAAACPQEHRIILFRPFYRQPNLQATRLIHELFHYYYYELIIHRRSNPRINAWSYQGFVSQLSGLQQVMPLEMFPPTCEEESEGDQEQEE